MCYDVVQGVAFAGPAVCMVACAMLTPAGAAHAPGSSPTTLIVALFSAAFAMGAWARAGLYCNHQVQCSSMLWLREAQTMLTPKGRKVLQSLCAPNRCMAHLGVTREKSVGPYDNLMAGTTRFKIFVLM